MNIIATPQYKFWGTCTPRPPYVIYVHDKLAKTARAFANKLQFATTQSPQRRSVKAKFHYAILVADRSEAGRRPAASWHLAYHALSSSLAAS